MTTQQTITLYSTNEYDTFKFLRANRKISENRKLLNAIRVHGQLQPVIVNERKEVIDGQHRIQICKLLGIPVNYIVKEGWGLPEILSMNEASRNWTMIQLMDSYAIEGNINYQICKKFKSDYGFTLSACIALLTGSNRRSSVTERDFRTGSFVVSTLDEAILKAEKITQIGKYWIDYKHQEFVLTMSYVLSRTDFSFDQFIAQLAKKRRGCLYVCRRRMEYLTLLQEIHNSGMIIIVALF